MPKAFDTISPGDVPQVQRHPLVDFTIYGTDAEIIFQVLQQVESSDPISVQTGGDVHKIRKQARSALINASRSIRFLKTLMDEGFIQ